MLSHERMVQRQQMLADFGEIVLRSESLDDVLTEACRLVSELLETGRAKILEIEQDGQSLLVRAGVGWNPGIVGHVHLPMSERSSETFSITAGKPVITQDINEENRFEYPDFMRQAGVVAIANVPIFLPGGKAYGLLQVDDRRARDFTAEDTQFLRTYSTILGPVIDRLLKIDALRGTEERFRLIVENARDYAIFVADAQDRISDWLPGAEHVFGWTAVEAIGQPSAILFTPEDREDSEDEKEVETALTHGVAPNVRWHIRKDGTRVFIEGTTTALRDADGSLRGFLKIGQDVTKRRLAAERQAFLLRLSDVLRPLTDAAEVIAAASEALGHHLGVGQVAYAEIDDAADTVKFAHEWNDGSIPSAIGQHRLEEFGRAMVADLKRGRTLAIGDVTRDPHTSSTAALATLERASIRSLLDVPLMKGGHLAAVLALHSGVPRPWSTEDITLAEDVAERTWAAVERARVEARLREGEIRYRALVEGVPQLVWRSLSSGHWTWSSPQWTAYTGRSEAASRDLGWLEALHPDDRETAMTAWARADEDGRPVLEARIYHQAEARHRWFTIRAMPLRDDSGIIVEWLGTSTDVDDMRRLQDEQKVMVAELQHRTRNLIGVVGSIAEETMAQTGPTEAFRVAFDDRLAALSRVQGLLSRADAEPITIEALIRMELDALGGAAFGDRIALAGPEIALRHSIVQTFALALHELATNARKYGALANEDGCLAVTWRLRHEEGSPWLELRWAETNIGPVRESAIPPTRGGYGRELIERALPYALAARTSYDFSGDEVRCSIDLPLAIRND